MCETKPVVYLTLAVLSLASVCLASPSVQIIGGGAGNLSIRITVDEAELTEAYLVGEMTREMAGSQPYPSVALEASSPFSTAILGDNPFLDGSPAGGDSMGLWVSPAGDRFFASFTGANLTAGTYDFLAIQGIDPFSTFLLDVQGTVVQDQIESQPLSEAWGVFVEPSYGDANHDGVVDGSDVLEVEIQFGATGPANGTLLGDANYDGVVNGSDVLEVEVNFGSSRSVLPLASAPEPASVCLAGMAVAGIVGFRRRR